MLHLLSALNARAKYGKFFQLLVVFKGTGFYKTDSVAKPAASSE
jgi:predicted nucleic acid-binding Zn ribbon protein